VIKMEEQINMFDLWTKENQWLTLNTIREKLGIEINSNQYHHLARRLAWEWHIGILKRKKVIRVCKRGRGYMKRRVYAYTPIKWVLHTVCDGFFKARENEMQ